MSANDNMDAENSQVVAEVNANALRAALAHRHLVLSSNNKQLVQLLWRPSDITDEEASQFQFTHFKNEPGRTEPPIPVNGIFVTLPSTNDEGPALRQALRMLNRHYAPGAVFPATMRGSLPYTRDEHDSPIVHLYQEGRMNRRDRSTYCIEFDSRESLDRALANPFTLRDAVVTVRTRDMNRSDIPTLFVRIADFGTLDNIEDVAYALQGHIVDALRTMAEELGEPFTSLALDSPAPRVVAVLRRMINTSDVSFGRAASIADLELTANKSLEFYVQVAAFRTLVNTPAELIGLLSRHLNPLVMLGEENVSFRHIYNEPTYCSTCRYGAGHEADFCPDRRCGRCFQNGHHPRNCPNEKARGSTYKDKKPPRQITNGEKGEDPSRPPPKRQARRDSPPHQQEQESSSLEPRAQEGAPAENSQPSTLSQPQSVHSQDIAPQGYVPPAPTVAQERAARAAALAERRLRMQDSFQALNNTRQHREATINEIEETQAHSGPYPSFSQRYARPGSTSGAVASGSARTVRRTKASVSTSNSIHAPPAGGDEMMVDADLSSQNSTSNTSNSQESIIIVDPSTGLPE